MTSKQKKTYIENNGTKCPFCNSNSIEGGFVESGSGQASQPMECKDCGTSWTDVYTLTNVVNVQKYKKGGK